MANKSQAANKTALTAIAPAAFAEGVSRAAVIATLRVAGVRHIDPKKASKATIAHQKAIRLEYTVGAFAARLKSNLPDDQRIANARDLLTSYMGYLDPVALKKAGKDMPKLAKGMKGRRTKEQEAALNATRVHLHALLKEMGVGTVSAQGAHNRKPRPSTVPASEGETSKPAAPKASELRDATPKYKNGAEVHAHLEQQAAMLLAFINKNASVVIPSDSSAVQDFIAALKKASK